MNQATDRAQDPSGIAAAHPEGTAVAIGKFEGIHRGHAVVLGRLLDVAQERGLGTVVLTFRENPLRFLAPERCPDPLKSPEQRRERLSALGVDDVVMLDFDDRFASLAPEAFVVTYLVGAFGARHVVVGEDFRFGAGARGDATVLRDLGERYGFSVEVVPEVQDDQHGRVSSSSIREALERGDVAAAAELLGHPHTVRGVVVHGDARGRELGFPTANLGPAPGATTIEGMVPADGVYAAFAHVRGGIHPAAVSVGNNPTFTPDAQSRVEAFLLDFSADLYGAEIEIQFLERIRDMHAFESLDALVTQMGKDVATARTITSARHVRSE